MIRTERLDVAVGGFRLSEVSFEVATGQWGVVIGPAGSGKTTLLEAIAGVAPTRGGRVLVGEKDVTQAGISERGVGLVYQHAYLFPHLTVEQNIGYGTTDASAAREMMARFDLGSLAARRVESLSGGERQLVAIARALAPRPRVLLLDEPFSALDPKRRNATRRLVRELHRQWGMTVLQVTHDFAEAGLLGEVTILMDQGRVLQWGASAEVFRRPASPYVAEFLGAENVLSGSVEGPTPGDDAPRVVAFRCGPLVIHAVSDAAPGPCHAVIRGEEMVLSREPQASSARNHFSGLVRELDAYGAWVRVSVDVEGVPLVALVTASSLETLALEPGSRVEVSFKAFAVHLC